MKKMVSLIIITALAISFCACAGGKTEKTQPEKRISSTEKNGQDKAVKALWLSVFDMDFLKDSRDDFAENSNKVFERIAGEGFDHIFLQVRPYADALYKSEIFPWSRFLSSQQGIDPGFDPLEILVENAHKNGIKIHAWINPYRILSEDDPSLLSDDNPAKKMIEENSEDIFRFEKGIFFDPSSERARGLILNGIREIVRNYDVDGIHIDDYFYPSTDEELDEYEYGEYSGEMTLSQWRMTNVDTFVSGMYSAVKSIDRECIVSISPSGNMEYNYDFLFADVKKWIGEKGYADWVIPQIYFGFENEVNPFEKVLSKWCEIKRDKQVKIIPGLALYKGGKTDENAGSGQNEWINNNDIISREISLVKEKSCDGYALYSYSSMDENNKEWQKIKAQ